MKTLVKVVVAVVAGYWIYNHLDWLSGLSTRSRPGHPDAAASQAPRAIVVAPFTRDEAAPDTSLADDDRAMAKDRLRNWQRQTNSREIQPSTPEGSE